MSSVVHWGLGRGSRGRLPTCRHLCSRGPTSASPESRSNLRIPQACASVAHHTRLVETTDSTNTSALPGISMTAPQRSAGHTLTSAISGLHASDGDSRAAPMAVSRSRRSRRPERPPARCLASTASGAAARVLAPATQRANADDAESIARRSNGRRQTRCSEARQRHFRRARPSSARRLGMSQVAIVAPGMARRRLLSRHDRFGDEAITASMGRESGAMDDQQQRAAALRWLPLRPRLRACLRQRRRRFQDASRPPT